MKRHLRALTATAGAALASLALLASAAQAETPAPPYEDFAGCPSPAENPFVASCFKIEFGSGHIELGKRDVPITNTVALRGGSRFTTGEFLGNSEAGIVPVQQPVPGGLIGLTGYEWLDELLDQPELKLFATIESAGQPGSTSSDPFALPVKVHLENPVLGSNCYVGSDENPLMLELTTKTTSPPPPNEPIAGKAAAKFQAEAERPAVRKTATPGVYVDNAYATPGVTGCSLKLGPFQIPVNNAVNASYGLPAAAGTNEAILDYTVSVVSPKVVYP